MAPDDAEWCAIPGDLVAEVGVVWLREPAWSNRQQLVERLRGGTYDKPFIVDDGETRRLHFDLTFMQSEMSLGDPQALIFRYVRKMMAFLLFLPKPRHVVIVGLGGGSLTKFCHRQLPLTRVTTVEIDRDVIALGELFDLPQRDGRSRVLHSDARDYFAQTAVLADVVLLDGCDRYGTAPELCSETFYRNVRARLHPKGMAVVNLTGTRTGVKQHLQLLAAVFEERVIVIDVPDCGNRLAFAFNDRQTPPDWQSVAQRADELMQRHGLDFHEYAQLLRRAYCRRKLHSKW